uniref:KOW domain-containing protein n=1 Tax=Thermosporothrix sp. COM3 TaxID=2490863 RepID=A0A455SSP0_9CHLR|nr:hypothetical protein KTC_52390 [Thermosporothrix sp. COM3]
MSYPLGWSVIPQMMIKRERWPGGNSYRSVIPLVRPGQNVLPEQPVIRVEQIRFQEVQPYQESRTSRSRLSLSSASNPALRAIPQAELVFSGLWGRVTELTRRGGVVIESRATVIQGKLGVGYQVCGALTLWHNGRITPQKPGTILVIPGPLTFSQLRQASEAGVAGVIAGSITLRDLEGFLRVDLLQLLASEQIERITAHLPRLTLMFTEGVGEFSMPARIANLLSSYQGAPVLLSGLTSTRLHLVPELLISLPYNKQEHWTPVHPDLTLAIGAYVRINSGEYMGATGVLDYIFSYDQEFPSGIRTRAMRVMLEDGTPVVVPSTSLERLG